MDQATFNKMMDNYLADLAARDPSAWSAEAREWAEGKGIIKGNEHGDKQYKKFCTREELVQILYNMEG